MQTTHLRLGFGPSFRPRLSPLEDRTNPSGNVTAVVFDGVLYVGGDDLANAFTVTGTGDGTATVAPADSTTTVEGQTGVVPFSGIRKGYHIVGGEGGDGRAAGAAADDGKAVGEVVAADVQHAVEHHRGDVARRVGSVFQGLASRAEQAERRI